MPRKKLKIIETPDKLAKAEKETTGKVGRPKMPKHVLKINDWLYVTNDKYGWMIMQVSDRINPKTGEKYPDKALAYSSTLDWMLKIMVQRLIRVPSDFDELGKKLQEVYDLIDARIPADTRPRDVFEECKYKQDE